MSPRAIGIALGTCQRVVRIEGDWDLEMSCGGELVLDRESFVTGPDTHWREQSIILVGSHCRRCGVRDYNSRRPATEEERERCLANGPCAGGPRPSSRT